MKRHQWSHKSEEEKQEWINQGKPNPVGPEERNKELLKSRQPHECTVCGKRFLFPVYLRKHQETHKDKSERESFVCEECGQICTTRAGLRFHTRGKHTPHLNLGRWKPCPIWPDAKFLSRTHLDTHMMRHHGVEKKFICDKCGRRFPSTGSLKEHMQVHLVKEGERPFQCENCGVSYKHGRNLRRHVQASHPDKYVQKYKASNETRDSDVQANVSL